MGRATVAPTDIHDPRGREGVAFLAFLGGMSYRGRPSADDLAKGTASDGKGPHRHPGCPHEHEHGEPSFTDAEAEYLQAQGLHVDRHHGVVSDWKGGALAPLIVGSMLSEACANGALKAEKGRHEGVSGADYGSVGQAVSGPGEMAPAVQHLDLRGG